VLVNNNINFINNNVVQCVTVSRESIRLSFYIYFFEQRNAVIM